MSFNLEHRLFVTRLYRKLLRQQLKWKDKEARDYGWNEVKQSFRTNKGETDHLVVKKLLHTADERYKVMMAYGYVEKDAVEVLVNNIWDPYDHMMSEYFSDLGMGKGDTKGGDEYIKYTHMVGKKKRGMERRENAERTRTRKLPEHEVAVAGVLEHTRITTSDADLKKNFTKKRSDKDMDESDYHFPDFKASPGKSSKR